MRSLTKLKVISRLSCQSSKQCKLFSTGVHDNESDTVKLAYDDYNSNTDPTLSPLIISHGMLGSRHNWSTIAKQLHKTTGRRILTVDARNHGDSPHVEKMSYPLMSRDIARLVNKELGLDRVNLAGHSMGGRTVMMAALENIMNIEKLIVLDISPINQKFDVTSSNEWNMEHYFHCLKAVNFNQSLSLSQARKDADSQLAHRIQSAGLRAWLLMNMKQDPVTKHIGWKMNIDAIHKSFYENIAKFPHVSSNFNRPTLFIGGAESDYIPVTDHEDIQETFPLAQFKYVQGAGHWVHSQKPAEVMQLMKDFLK